MCNKYIYQVFGSKSHDAKDGFFYPSITFMINYYSLINNIKQFRVVWRLIELYPKLNLFGIYKYNPLLE